MTKKEALRLRARRERSGVTSVLLALQYFSPLFVTPGDVAAVTHLPFGVVMKSLRQLLRINPFVECDDGAEDFRVRFNEARHKAYHKNKAA